MQIPYVSTVDLPWVGKMSKIRSLCGFESHILAIYFTRDTLNDAIWKYISDLQSFIKFDIHSKFAIDLNKSLFMISTQ